MILVMIIMLPKSKVPHEYLNFHTVMHQIKVAKPHSSADDSELKKLDCSMIQKVIQCRTIRDSFSSYTHQSGALLLEDGFVLGHGDVSLRKKFVKKFKHETCISKGWFRLVGLKLDAKGYRIVSSVRLLQ